MKDSDTLTGNPLWFKVLAKFAEAYQWLPEQVADLTVEQMLAYGGTFPDDLGINWMDPEDFKAKLLSEM